MAASPPGVTRSIRLFPIINYDLQTMLDDALIEILRCPETRQPLRRATGEEKRAQDIPDDEETLVSLDGTRFYRGLNGLPSLLPPANEEVSGG